MSVVTITNKKANTLEFDIAIGGMNPAETAVRFVVVTEEMNMTFEAKKTEGDTWSVTIPALASLVLPTYSYHIEIVVDGYYFQPAKGVLNVIETHELQSTTPKNVTLGSDGDKKEETKKDGDSTAVDSKATDDSTKKQDVREAKKPVIRPRVPSNKKARQNGGLLRSLANIPPDANKPDSTKDVNEQKVDTVIDQKVRDILRETRKAITAPIKKPIVKLH